MIRRDFDVALILTALVIGFACLVTAVHLRSLDSRVTHLERQRTPHTSATPVPRASSTRASRSRRLTDPRHAAAPRSHGRDTRAGSLVSTAYCETGLMANGHRTYIGAVAANRWPLGTRLHVSNSPYGPGTFTVEDRYGWGTQLDFATPGDCALARRWGRRTVQVQVLP